MKIFIIIVCILMAWNVFAETTQLKPVKIKNICNENYPEADRKNYNKPQYQLGYDRCLGAYIGYSSGVENGIKFWEIASLSNKQSDWDNAETEFYNAYNIMVSNGENLVGWFDRDIVLTNLGQYLKGVKEKVSLIPSTPKNTNTGATTANTGATTANTGATNNETLNQNLCKPGYQMNQVTKKCRKALKTKVKITP